MANKEKRMYIATILTTIILLMLILVQNFASFYLNAVSEAEALGQSCLTAETEQLEAYINKGMDVLKVVADSVEYMLAEGAESSDIEKYLVSVSDAYIRDVDENCTGLYGVVNGDYVDGVGWVPDEDYVPTERDWYIDAAAANGKAIIVPPYVDAQTGSIIISLARMLNDKSSVISFDIVLNNVQEITKNINLDNNGYGFIITDTGLVIAHYDDNKKGLNFLEDPEMSNLAKRIINEKNGSFVCEIDGKKSTVFTNTIFNDWHISMAVSNTRLLEGFLNVLIKDIIISLIIILVIIVFYTLTFNKMNALLIHEEEITSETKKLNENIVKALAHTIDAKDRYTRGHSQRVAGYAMEIAKRAGKSEEEQQNIYYAGLLHDVGKIRVPEEVINKPGKLTDEEFAQIKLHPISSYYILKDIYKDKIIADGARFHHERYDGKGYPNGLKENAIPEAARIIGVADAYDAMASNRSYRSALAQEKVRSEIEKGAGVQFDPEFARIMLQMIDEDKDYKMCEYESTEKNILIIEENEELKNEMLATFTEDIPAYKTTCASNGEAALNAMRETSFDLVIIDIDISTDAFEILKKLKSISDVPTVFLISDKNAETVSSVIQSGADDYITKPFLSVVLREIAHSLMNG